MCIYRVCKTFTSLFTTEAKNLNYLHSVIKLLMGSVTIWFQLCLAPNISYSTVHIKINTNSDDDHLYFYTIFFFKIIVLYLAVGWENPFPLEVLGFWEKLLPLHWAANVY